MKLAPGNKVPKVLETAALFDSNSRVESTPPVFGAVSLSSAKCCPFKLLLYSQNVSLRTGLSRKCMFLESNAMLCRKRKNNRVASCLVLL